MSAEDDAFRELAELSEELGLYEHYSCPDCGDALTFKPVLTLEKCYCVRCKTYWLGISEERYLRQ